MRACGEESREAALAQRFLGPLSPFPFFWHAAAAAQQAGSSSFSGQSLWASLFPTPPSSLSSSGSSPAGSGHVPAQVAPGWGFPSVASWAPAFILFTSFWALGGNFKL